MNHLYYGDNLKVLGDTPRAGGAGFVSEEQDKSVRGLRFGPGRSADFRAGHRLALRAAVAWLHAEAATMNDPHARRILETAATGLGAVAGAVRDKDREAQDLQDDL